MRNSRAHRPRIETRAYMSGLVSPVFGEVTVPEYRGPESRRSTQEGT
jgi:hypothetical protein